MREKVRKTLALLLSAAALVTVSPLAAASGGETPEQTEQTETTPAPTPEATSAPAETPEPVTTPEPEETPAPEHTATPEAPVSPEPEDTPAPETSPTPEVSPTPELPAEGEILDTRESRPEPVFYDSGLAEGLTFPQAIHILLSDLRYTFEQTAAAARETGELESARFVYEQGEGSPTASSAALPYVAAAFAAYTGKTADELQSAALTARELASLRAVFRKMSDVSCTLTETDVAAGVLDETTGEPSFTTKRELTVSFSLSGDTSPLGLDAGAYARYKALRAGTEWEKLVSLCGGDGWVESGAGAPVSSLRDDVVRLALAQQGKIAYRWGGKYNALGRDAAWSFPQQSEDGGMFVDGLDCSGFITWVFINAAGTTGAAAAVGEGTSAQRRACEEISREEVQPGDLVFGGDGSPESEHIGIVTGFTSDGRVLMCHCMNRGVTVSYADEFGMDTYYRPAAYYAAYETPGTVPELSVAEYAGSANGTVWLVTVAETASTRCRWTFDGAEMLYSEAYGAWCALTADPAAAETRISRVRQNGRIELSYDGDVNVSGITDINDVQRIYSIGCGQQSFEAKNADAWLKADLNGDGRVTADDASELLRFI